MTTLEDAWAWYQATSDGAKRLAHLAKHWDSLPWDSQDRWVGLLQRDGVLRHIESEQLSSGAKTIQDGLDDLTVLVLFSVFEAIVRALIGEQVRVEAAQLRHPSLKKAGTDALQAIADGSFFRVLESYKSQANEALIEQLNQVRHYRNWVAHGRRPLQEGEQMAKVDPREAYERLSEFLKLIQSSKSPHDSESGDSSLPL